MKEAVVLVHGIWMTGVEMSSLARHLRLAGYLVYRFRYQSVRRSPARNAEFLFRYISSINTGRVHIVAHSLGGIVLSHLMSRLHRETTEVCIGRVVLLGSPLGQSNRALAYSRHRLARFLLGKSVDKGLLGGHPPWEAGVPTGMIAGTTGVGLGSVLFGDLVRPNDGTVAVSETLDPALTDHLCVPYNHVSMLFSPVVAKEVICFLREGAFCRRSSLTT